MNNQLFEYQKIKFYNLLMNYDLKNKKHELPIELSSNKKSRNESDELINLKCKNIFNGINEDTKCLFLFDTVETPNIEKLYHELYDDDTEIK